jgi:hypothetical protein
LDRFRPLAHGRRWLDEVAPVGPRQGPFDGENAAFPFAQVGVSNDPAREEKFNSRTGSKAREMAARDERARDCTGLASVAAEYYGNKSGHDCPAQEPRRRNASPMVFRAHAASDPRECTRSLAVILQIHAYFT